MRLAQFLLLVVFAAVFSGLAGSEGFACTCQRPRTAAGKNFQPCVAFSSSDVVFFGTVTKISIQRSNKRIPFGQMTATFSVQKAIRGVGQRTVQIGTISSTALCGYPFRKGESYFVSVKRGGDGNLTETLCGLTLPLSEAKLELDYLRAIETGKEGGRVYGTVQRRVQTSSNGDSGYEQSAEVTVRLSRVETGQPENVIRPESMKRQFETKTNEDGFYLFTEIPEGKYTVDIDLPSGSRLLYSTKRPPFYVVVDYGRKIRCGAVYFLYTSMVDAQGVKNGGRPPAKQHISLYAG